jgi:hypothetical protein
MRCEPNNSKEADCCLVGCGTVRSYDWLLKLYFHIKGCCCCCYYHYDGYYNFLDGTYYTHIPSTLNLSDPNAQTHAVARLQLFPYKKYLHIILSTSMTHPYNRFQCLITHCHQTEGQQNVLLGTMLLPHILQIKVP